MKATKAFLVIPVLFLGLQDTTNDGRERIRKADLEFSKLSKELGPLQAFLTYLTEDAYLLHPDEMPLQGQNAIIAQYGSFPKNASLTWEPTAVECSESGELGYSLGKYLLKRVGQDGISRMSEGFYLTVWKQQADGQLRAIADMGAPEPMSQESPGVSIARIPLRTEKSSADDFGVAFGTYQMKIRKLDGKDSLAIGKYVHAWKKKADGSKNTMIDMSNSTPPPK
ncbi:MAG: DUF4440 domain-containing protein [Ignavibacteriales bacterium]|nr:DUF4440 domain-containing protein [Ignavibacteriales bacterium]